MLIVMYINKPFITDYRTLLAEKQKELSDSRQRAVLSGNSAWSHIVHFSSTEGEILVMGSLSLVLEKSLIVLTKVCILNVTGCFQSWMILN